MSARASWTQEDVERATTMWSGGASATSIARRLGKTRNAVLGKIGRLGLSRKHQPTAIREVRSGSMPGQRQQPGVSPGGSLAWTPDEDRDLARLWDDGYTTDEIATRMTRAEADIVGRAGRLGLLVPEPTERFADAGWFVRHNARFCRAMKRALDSGLVRIPADVDDR